MMRTALVLALTPLLIVACAGTGARAPESKPLAVINLTAGPEDGHRAWMALRLADHFLTYGRDVVVFMNVKAPPLGSTKVAADFRFEDKPPFREVVADLVKRGARILVCGECAAKTGVGKADLLPGVAFADRDSLFGGIDERTVVFSY